MRRPDDGGDSDEPRPGATARESDAGGRRFSRRGLLAAAATTASAGAAGCSGRLPTGDRSVDTVTRREDGSLVWEYPTEAVRDDGGGESIGYAAVEFDALDRAWHTDEVLPSLAFTLNSTVGTRQGGEERGYRADRFRFAIGLPRTYDGVSGVRAVVAPPPWPELRTNYRYEGTERVLTVAAPEVGTDGTITVEGRLRAPDATLPRRLHCEFAVRASQPGVLGRTVTAQGRTTVDVSTLDLPEGVSTG